MARLLLGANAWGADRRVTGGERQAIAQERLYTATALARLKRPAEQEEADNVGRAQGMKKLPNAKRFKQEKRGKEELQKALKALP